MDAALQAAREAGMNVLQTKTPVPVGYQGRFETHGDYVVELAELSEDGKQYFNSDLSEFGF
jgi:hypothetical protein